MRLCLKRELLVLCTQVSTQSRAWRTEYFTFSIVTSWYDSDVEGKAHLLMSRGLLASRESRDPHLFFRNDLLQVRWVWVEESLDGKQCGSRLMLILGGLLLGYT